MDKETTELIKDSKKELVERGVFENSTIITRINNFLHKECIELNKPEIDNEIKENIKKLKHGEVFTIPESDYGKAEVWRIWDTYILFGIPTYGGTPYFDSVHHLNRGDPIGKIMAIINKWT